MTKLPQNGHMSDQDDAFHTTHWTQIFDAGSQGQPQGQAALHELLSQYWKPVYHHLCAKGYDREEAKDLTQGFFYEIVLGRDLIQLADRSKGRFRTFLLTALDRYATDSRRTGKRKKRRPEGGIINLDDVDWLSVPDPDGPSTQVFDRTWARTVLDQTLSDLEAHYRKKGKASLWEVFGARVLAPIMENAPATSLPELCAKYGISDTAKASKMIIRVKRRFRSLLRRRVRQLVNSDAKVDDEIRYLMKICSTSHGPKELSQLFSSSSNRTASPL